MKRTVLALVALSLLAIGCPGQKPPNAPVAAPKDKDEGPLVWKLSKSGLGFRLSNADEDADKPVDRKVAPSTPLAAKDAQRIAARLPALKLEPDDTKDFAMRDKSIPAPRPGKTVNEPFPPPAGPPPASATPAGPLKVERHAPEGNVDLAPHLTMTFTQPMVAVTGVDELGKEKPPVALVPQPPGKWRWLGTRTLMFQPEKRFPMATEYAVDIPAGTRSTTGQALTQAVHWTFSTPPVTLKRSWPGGSSEPREPIMFAEFDQQIDQAEMLKSIELSSGKGPIGITLAPADEIESNDQVRRMSQAAEKGRWIAFKAEGKLPTQTSFTARFKAGTPSAEGPRRTTKDQAFGFTTFGPMRVTHHHCNYWGSTTCSPLQAFHVQFSNPIDLKTFDKSLISVAPEIPNMKVTASGNNLTISGKTKGRTHYVVKVAGAIGDTHEQTMGQEAKVEFDVGPADPALFGAEREMLVLDPSSPRSYTVYSINEPGLHVRALAVGPEDWKKYVEYHHEWERPRKIQAPGRVVFDKVITPKKAPDELVGTSIDLAPALTGGVGQVLLIVEPTRAPPKGYFRAETHVWLQSTELGLSARIENDQVLGWVTKLADGTSIADAEISILGAGTGKTDGSGLGRVVLDNKVGTLLFAKRGKDTAILPEGYYGSSSFHKVDRSAHVRWFVFDDRGMYKPGEDGKVKGWVRRAQLNRGGDLDMVPDIKGKTVHWKIRDPRGAEIGTGDTVVDDQGAFDLGFKLPGNANLGYAHIDMELRGSGLANEHSSHGFQIQEFRRPEFEVTAKSSEGPHSVGRHAIATLSATYYSGGGLPDAPVKWNVTRSTTSFTPPNRSGFHFGPDHNAYWSWRSSKPQKGMETKTEEWTSHTNPQGIHRLRVDFDGLEPPYPMALSLRGNVEDVNRQQWAGSTSMIVHPASDYVGLRPTKQFVRAGENVELDLVVTDIDGKHVPGRAIQVKAARIDWEQKGAEWEEKELDVQKCDATSPSGKDNVETARCSMRVANGGTWRITAIIADAHGRKNQSAMQLYVMGNDIPKGRGLDKAKVTIVSDKKEYKPGDLVDLLVVAPFAPAEGLLTVERQGIVHVERFSMTSASTALKVKLEEAHVPNVLFDVELLGAEVRDGPTGDPDPALPKRPAYASGSSGVRVLPVNRTLDVKAGAKKATLDPGASTQIDVEVKDNAGRAVRDAEVAVIVADEAVLALSSYKTPDPISIFYAGRSADVRGLGLRDRVLLADPTANLRPATGQAQPGGGVNKQMRGGMGGARGDFGGGDGFGAGLSRSAAPAAQPVAPAAKAAATTTPIAEMAMDEKQTTREEERSKKKEDRAVSAGESAPEKPDTPIAMRKDFSALAMFAPRVRTDASGRATVPLKLPDNLTRYRVMAIASAGEKQFGVNESTITARLPIMVRPSAPRFLNFGDRFEMPVVVQNQTDDPIDVDLFLRATNAVVDAPDAKRVKIAPNDRVEVRFNAATLKPGTARFQIGAAAGNYADASQVEMPVYTPATTEAFATYGEIDEGAMAQPVKMPPGVFPQFGGLEVTTSSTQLQALTDAFLYLVRYKFECNEQLASRVVSIAALKDVLNAFKAADMPKPEELRAFMAEDFAKLKRRQHYDGGWGFWQETPWPYLTVHVTHALVRAKEKGFKPDEQMLSRAKSYLRSIESKYPWWYTEETRRAITSYALFVRKRMDDPDPNRAKKLIQEAGGVEKMPIEALGWLWPTLSDDKNSTAENEAIRRHVTNRVTETAGNAHFVSSYKDAEWVMLSSDRRADGVLLESMIGDQPDSTVIPKLVKGLLAHRKKGRWTNTQENAFVLLALDRYFNKYEKITPDFVARVWLGDRFAGQHQFKGRTTEYSEIKVPMNWLATETKGQPQNLTLGKDGPGRLYYRVGMQYAPTDLKMPPTDQGFIVSRTYEGADKPEDVRRDGDGTWRVKAGAKVRVRVSMVNQSRRYHVALVDPIPAGFEPMNPALAVTGEIPKDPKAQDASAKNNRYWYWSRTWYEHQNMRDERVEAFTSLLWDGVWDYTYVAKATTPGIFVVPPSKAEEMYAPETFGRGAGDRVIVE